MKAALWQALRWGVIGGAITAAVYALILARASQLFERDTPVSVAAAVRIQPHNALYLDRLASWQPDNRPSLLARSVAEDPFNYNAWIRLGLLAEMQDGDNTAAEKYYLKAAEVNHMFLPKWTLANFYFRQQQPQAFFRWTKETLAITPYASDPVFAQMWQMTQDEATLNAAIPDRPRILLQYAWYLSNSRQYTGIPRAVERLVQAVGSDDPRKWGRDDLLAVIEDHLLAAGQLKAAINVWSTLKNAGWLHETVPNDQRPLTNGDFAERFYGHGFDWVSVENPGTRVDQNSDTAELRISLYGDEAEKITLLQQYVAAAPNTRYSMTWEAQAGELNDPSGLAWHLRDTRAEPAGEVVSGDLLAPAAKWDFVSPPGAEGYLLTLEYRRPPGITRARGSVGLKSVTMNQK
jgi:hypothetical protein